MKIPRLSDFKEPLGLFTLLFVLLFTLFCLFQILFFRYYLHQSMKTKVENTLNQVENKLEDYVKFLENFYKIPFIPEFAELPESKGWLIELVDFLEDLFKREKFLSLAIFYQKKPFLVWNYKEKGLPFERCQNQFLIEGNLLKAQRRTILENKEYCLYLALDISYYQSTFQRYALIVVVFYLITLAMVFSLFFKFIEAESRKREAERRLQAERELALLGRMAATLAHELRNSLNNLFLLWQASSQDPSLHQKLTEEIKGLLNWTQDILLFHKEIALNPRYFDPEDLIFEMKLLSANASGEIAFEVEKHLSTLWGDPFWLKKALENLIKNSLQVLKDRGQIKLTFKKEGKDYLLEVYDSGPPIPEDLKEKLFEPFFSTKKEGFGLGLYLVKKIIEAHQGQIEIENTPGGGKIFRLRWQER